MSVADDFEEAFRETQQKHPLLNRGTGRVILATLEQTRSDNERKKLVGTFTQDLDSTLNLFKVHGDERLAYRALAGSYFGKRGSSVRHHK